MRVLAAVAVCGVLACLACSSSGARPAASASRVSPSNGPQVLLNEADAPGWPDHAGAGATAWLDSGGYHLFAGDPGQFVAVRAPHADVPHDLQVSARMRKVGGPPGGGYGVIVNDSGASRGDGVDQSGEYVVAEVGDRGQVGIWRRDNTRWVDLVPWTASPVVAQADAPNQLDVWTVGTRVLFFVNGTQVASVDGGMRGPDIGVFAGGDGNEVVLERFSVQPVQPGQQGQPGQPTAAPTPAPLAVSSASPSRTPSPSAWQRIQELLSGIAHDVAGIYQSFAGGPNDPHSPVKDRTALNEDAQRLGAAQAKAHQLADELQKLKGAADPSR